VNNNGGTDLKRGRFSLGSSKSNVEGWKRKSFTLFLI